MRATTPAPTDGATPGEPGALSASGKTLIVLEATLTHARFSEVVAATGLPKATVHRIIATLAGHGFVTVDTRGEYLPGPRILQLAGQALRRIDISRVVQPFVDELVARVHCTVHVGVRNGDEVVYLVRTDSDKPYRMPSRIGDSVSMHATGIGKSILAQGDDDAAVRYAARTGLPRRTATTITTLPGLLDELADIRVKGYALDRGENVPGVACIAVPILDHTGQAAYGMSISTLSLEHSEDQIVAMHGDLQDAARAVSAALGHRTT